MNTRFLILSTILSTTLACGASSDDGDTSPTTDSTSVGDGDTSDETVGGTSPSGPETGESEGGDGDGGDGDAGDGDAGDGDAGDGDGDSGDGDTGDGDAALGEAVWTEDGHQERCTNCHSNNGQYGPEALATGMASESAILDRIVNGGEIMPPQVPEEMSYTDAAHLAAYFWSLANP
jgi:hypothetical protein